MFNRLFLPFRLGEASAVSRAEISFFLGLCLSVLLLLIFLVWVVGKLVKVIKRWKRKRDLQAYYQKMKSKQKSKK